MANISLLMLPEAGHYMPTLRLCRSLAERGHTTTHLTIPPFKNFFDNLGLRCQTMVLPGLPITESNIFSTPGSAEVIRNSMNAYVKSCGISISEALSTVLCGHNTDLLLYDTALARYIEPSALKYKAAMLNPILPGLTVADRTEFILCPESLEIPGTYDRNSRLYGEPSITDLSGRVTDSATPYDLDDTYTLCTFGTQWQSYPQADSIMKAIIEAFVSMPSRKLVVVANGIGVTTQRSLPQNVHILTTAPQRRLLSKANVFITHGGLGGTKEAILSKVPMLVIPFMYDQPANARRIEHHRLGTMIQPRDCSSRRIMHLVEGLVDNDDVKDRLEAMSMSFVKHELEAPIAGAIDKIVTEH